ncbi:carbohydrate ABC transporter permease [Geminicoccus roseus]|uniref:carbohydrate ABC transporter permease n=1 Tax=Geminicoccus roseus TaxID=404900 RepID=UPI0006865B32|nr:sugar ABC transporter permease [Geminicoccus roseus]
MARPAGSRQRWTMLALVAPAVGVLLIWMIVPLAMTIYFSLQRFNILYPERFGFVGFRNFQILLNDPLFWSSMGRTLILVGASLAVTVILGIVLALVMEREFPGRSIARLMALAPFFVMPVVAALVWKNMLMHPVYGLLSWLTSSLGLPVVDWLQNWPMTSIVIIVAWQWTPFAMLVFLTSLQSMPEEQKEAAWLDGANPLQMFFSIILPHLSRAITAVVMIESIFFLSIFAEIFTTTGGGPGQASTTLTYIIYARAFLEWNVGSASAGGLFAVVLANIVAILLIRMVARNMQNPEKFG